MIGKKGYYQLRRIGSPASMVGARDTFVVDKEITVVGRNAKQCDIFLASIKDKALISRLHARIFKTFDKDGSPVFKVCDTSLNGTFVNDVKISDTVQIRPGDTLTFGHLKGAVLDPGAFALQENSEFRFKFEMLQPACNDDQVISSHSLTDNVESKIIPDLKKFIKSPPSPKTPLVPTIEGIPDVSVFLSPDTPLRSAMTSTLISPPFSNEQIDKQPGPVETKRIQDTEDLSCTLSTTTKTELIVPKPCNSASNITNDDKELLALAAASRNAMSDSDDELFSPYCSEDPYPRTSGSSSPVYPPVDSRDDTATALLPTENVDRAWKNNWRKIPAFRKRRRSHRLTYVKGTKSTRNSTNKTSSPFDLCASVACIRPHENDEIVDWVACDDCNSWYHIKCTGLSRKTKSVDLSSSMFHCGCV